MSGPGRLSAWLQFPPAERGLVNTLSNLPAMLAQHLLTSVFTKEHR
jgi:hypothetical protein